MSDTPFTHPLTSTDRESDVDDLDPDIKKLLCEHCWETTFSPKSFQAMWEASSEENRIKNKSKSQEDWYKSSLTYRTPPWAKVLESAEANCGYCTFLRNANRTLPTEPAADEELVVTVIFDLASAVPRLKIRIWDTRSSATPYNTGIYAEPEDPASRYIAARNVVWKVEDSASYQLALKCVDDCSKHGRCPRPEPTTLPTRVLDCIDPLKLQLVTTDHSKKDFFAALSYVWGGPQPHCTTKENIHEYRNFIDPTIIPKTISDAITVMRRLGLRYLWVDSFCIIQDSDEDKAHELGRMRLNFRNSFITIVAARANAVGVGFLQNVFPSLHFKPIRLPFRCPDGTMGTITVVRHAELSEPVDERAWCLEERVLSPRLLIFGTLGLQYECQAGRVNVNGSPLGLPHMIPRLPDYAFTDDPGKDMEWQLDLSWDKILQRYTGSSLTREQDKLVALGGVAEQVHRLWPHSRYAAGLWTHQFPAALLWHQHDRRLRPKVYMAPSWSWAAVNGRVEPRRMVGNVDSWRPPPKASQDAVSICEVKDVVIHLKHASNPYGEVTSARLVLSAELVRATWNTLEESQIYTLTVDESSECGLLMSGKRSPECGVGFVTLDAIECPELPDMEVTLAGVLKKSVPLPLIVRLGQHDISGLALVPAHEKGENGVATYRRIGNFTMNAENWSSGSRQDIYII